MSELICTQNAPAAVGPYSQAVKTGNLLFVSGQLPIDPLTKNISSGSIRQQTYQSLKNIEAILEAANMDLGNVVKTSVFLSDMDDFNEMNEVYITFFKTDSPARTTVQVARLPKGARVEIEAVAAGNG